MDLPTASQQLTKRASSWRQQGSAQSWHHAFAMVGAIVCPTAHISSALKRTQHKKHGAGPAVFYTAVLLSAHAVVAPCLCSVYDAPPSLTCCAHGEPPARAGALKVRALESAVHCPLACVCLPRGKHRPTAVRRPPELATGRAMWHIARFLIRNLLQHIGVCGLCTGRSAALRTTVDCVFNHLRLASSLLSVTLSSSAPLFENVPASVICIVLMYHRISWARRGLRSVLPLRLSAGPVCLDTLDTLAWRW